MKTSKKNNKQKEIKAHRIPRPLGITLLAQQTRNNHNNQISPDIIQRIISYSLSHSLQLNNKQLTIETLAIYLNMPKTTIMKAYIEYQDKMAKVMIGNKDKLQGALLFLGLNKILEDKARIDNQARILETSQGGVYKAFISTEVNHALGLNLQATKAIVDLYKAISGPNNGTSNPINIQNNISNTPIQAVGINEALNILNKEGLLNLDYGAPNPRLIEAHNLHEVPEVRATHMAKVATDGIAFNTEHKSKHEDRRAIEEGLDLDNHID